MHTNYTDVPLTHSPCTVTGWCARLLCGLSILVLAPERARQQALTWDQVKSRFEAVNPALKADADNVDEMQAEEITAFLRPNPQFTLSADGTQAAPHNGVWTPFKGTTNSRTSVTCTSAITSANCAWRARRKARASRNRSMRTWSATWCSPCARRLSERSQAKFVLDLAKADLDYYDKIIDISRATLQGRRIWRRSILTASSCCACSTSRRSKRRLSTCAPPKSSFCNC